MPGEVITLDEAIAEANGVIAWLHGMSGGEPGVSLTWSPGGGVPEVTYIADAAHAARTLRTLLFAKGLA